MNWYNGSEPQDDGDYPVMTNEDVVDMVCGKQEASVSEITRLEDLREDYHRELLEFANGERRMCSSVSVYRVLDYDYDLLTSDDDGTHLTERGRALVADYQRRHMSDSQFDEYIAGKNAQASDERQPAGRKSQTSLEITKEIAETCAQLEAEKQALEAEVKELREALDTFAYVYQHYLAFCIRNDEPQADFENWITNYGDIYQSAYRRAHSIIYPGISK